METHTAYIGLGSNLGNTEENLNAALSKVKVRESILSVEASSFYATRPLTGAGQPDYLNAVARVQTTALPYQLLEVLQEVENLFGRERKAKWGPRTLDLDILLYEDVILNEPDLVLPHPQMHLRSFVLKGLCELAPDLEHPVLKRSMHELAERLNGEDFWLNPNRPQLISIAGNIGVGKTTLATGLAGRLGVMLILEKYDANPYLADVYAGKTELALDSELFFLSSSASQLRKDRMKLGRVYVNDYVFQKAHIYASGWLGPKDLVNYEKHFTSICQGVTEPVLVIYLKDTPENCMRRIHQRNRPYEQQIEMPFLEHLAHGYDTLYTDYTGCPVIRIRPDQCRTAEQVDRIAEEVQFYIARPQE